jgi:hypothetical protein
MRFAWQMKKTVRDRRWSRLDRRGRQSDGTWLEDAVFWIDFDWDAGSARECESRMARNRNRCLSIATAWQGEVKPRLAAGAQLVATENPAGVGQEQERSAAAQRFVIKEVPRAIRTICFQQLASSETSVLYFDGRPRPQIEHNAQFTPQDVRSIPKRRARVNQCRDIVGAGAALSGGTNDLASRFGRQHQRCVLMQAGRRFAGRASPSRSFAFEFLVEDVGMIAKACDSDDQRVEIDSVLCGSLHQSDLTVHFMEGHGNSPCRDAFREGC